MVKHIVAVTLVALAIFSTVGAAAPTVRTMYTDAMAKEQAVRTAWVAPDTTDAILNAVRETIATYEAVVRHYPASGYSDNALWQAARLATDAYTRFKQPADKETAARLLKKLAAMYPSSKLVKQIPEQIARVEAVPPAPAAPPPAPASPARTTAPAGAADVPPPTAARTSARPAATSTAGSLATIRSIRRNILPDGVRVTIELDGEVPFHEERIPDPSRVFVDLPGTRAAASIIDRTIRFETDNDVVRQVRIGRHPNNTTRVVLDAAGVSSYSVYPLYEPYRLVIDCMREATMTTAVAAHLPVPPKPLVVVARREVPPLAARTTTSLWMRSTPSLMSQRAMAIADARRALIDSAALAVPPALPAQAPSIAKAAESLGPTVPPPTQAAPKDRNSTGGLSIARQLGLGVSRIVIDPGHGGHDSGAKGRGVVESELVLDVALRLEKLLQKVPGVEVILTRRTDDFIELPERTAMANREGADLFLSIHANASSSALAHGVETYYLNFATNLSAAAVAARENANSTQAMGALPDIVKAIALNNKLDESHDLASHVQSAMIERLRQANKTVKDLGVKQAPFVVLIGAVMPSVLAEISFVTNPQEAKLLKSNTYRQRIADALFTAVRNYQTSLKGATAVVTQRD